MKFFTWLLTTLFYLQINTTAQHARAAIDVQGYVFNIELSDKNDSIKGLAVIHFKLLQRTESITLDLISQTSDGKGMKISIVTENGKPLAYTHSNDIVRIRLPASVNPNDERRVQIKYEGIPADGLIIAKNKYNHRTFFADHWPNRARHWLPCVDHPADKAAIEFIVTAPVHYQVISNGVLVEETNLTENRKLTHYKETVPLPMKVAAIGVADFAVHYEGEIGNIPVHSWVYPEDKVKGFYDYNQATEILPFFIKNVGPYAYKKLANVQSKTIFGGMENAGAIFYSESSVTGNRSSEGLIAHEIAHQWFGNMATEAEWAHVWLSEGFATYMSILYMESKYGPDTAIKALTEDRMQIIDFSKQRSAPVVDSSTTSYLELLNANSYQKGGWILHMPRKQLGDSSFWNGVRSYYAQYAGKNAVTEDFRKVMEKISGKDLKTFFTQWLYTPGHPQLDIHWQFDPGKKLLTLTIMQQQTTLFEFPLEIRIAGSGKNGIVKKIPVKEKQSVIKIPLTGKPSQILVDPGVDLLYEGTVRERN